jgi:catechol 2,3-dioxygenase-like lactoylglutathione lyase family enzyme
MIRGIHGLLYSSDPEATRSFFKDLVQLPGSDVGEGWWIFDFPEGDLGVHPVDDPKDAGKHDVSFYCDDIAGTVKALRARGVEFQGDVEDHGYGLVTYFTAPGGITVQLYEPRYVKGGARKQEAGARPKAAKNRAAGARPGAAKKRVAGEPARRAAATRSGKRR